MIFFQCDNSYEHIAGGKEYRDYVEGALLAFNSQVTFPIRVTDNKFRVKSDAFSIEKAPQISTLFITNLTELMRQEEHNYAKTHKNSLTNLLNKCTLDYH